MNAFVAFTEELADAARAEALRWIGRDLRTQNKASGGAFDPVTEADRGAEQVMRALIEARFPSHGIQGEEFGAKPGTGRHAWSLDPIDGTRSFICGLPTWTMLIALLEEGRPVLGVIDVPRLGERFVGHGDVAELVTAVGREPLATSGCRALAEARLSTTDPYLFDGAGRAAFERVRARVPLTRYGLDAYAYARLAAGGIDLVIEDNLQPHDLNALIPIVRAAGGAATNWRGEDEFSEGRLIAAASPALLDAALALFATA